MSGVVVSVFAADDVRIKLYGCWLGRSRRSSMSGKAKIRQRVGISLFVLGAEVICCRFSGAEYNGETNMGIDTCKKQH